MSRHVGEQALAAFREDLLPARKAARITAHLATCQRCAEVDAQLDTVTTILARTPAPPMPASVASRLDAALAAEIARSAAASPSEAASAAGAAPPAGAASPASAASPAGAPSRAAAPAPGEHAERRGGTAGRGTAGRRDGPGRAPWRLSPRLAAVAAAVVIVAGGGYAVARVLSARPTGTSASSSAASHSAISKPAALGPSAREVAPAAPVGTPSLVVASGTHYLPGQLAGQVGAVLRSHPAPRSSPNWAALPAAAAAFPHLHMCVALFAGGVQPRLVDVARYGNQRAAVIVVPGPSPANLRVWVVGPRCSAQGHDILAQVSVPAAG